MKFEVFNVVSFDEKNLAKTLEKLFPEQEKMVVNIVFVSENEIQKLNKDFRDKNELTDVLSFKLSDEISEIYLCPEYIKKSAQDFEKEIVRMIIHGILHIKGYNHEGYFEGSNVDEEMFQFQERYLKEFYDILEK
jgi:probable rRNA maturation factor